MSTHEPPARPGTHPTGFGTAFTPPRRAPRAPLTQDAVVGAAVRVLDTEGADALTFRRLAAELQVGVASLYWHVASKDVLLDLALDLVLSEVLTPTRASRKRWPTQLREAGIALYETFLRHRWAAGQMMRSSDRGPNTLRLWEFVAAIFAAAGFSLEQGLDGLSLLTNYILASAIQEATWDPIGAMTARERHAQLAQIGGFLRTLDPAQFPTVVASADVFATHDQGKQFAAGLDVILAGLEQQRGGR